MADLVAQDVMTREVVTIPNTATLRDAAEIFTAKHISGAPVIEADGKVVGMVTEADILDFDRREAAIPRTGAFGVFLISEEQLKKAYDDGLALSVEKLMARKVISATPHTPLTELMRLMVTKKINRIPIVDGNRLAGIVTREDVLRGLLASTEKV